MKVSFPLGRTSGTVTVIGGLFGPDPLGRTSGTVTVSYPKVFSFAEGLLELLLVWLLKVAKSF